MKKLFLLNMFFLLFLCKPDAQQNPVFIPFMDKLKVGLMDTAGNLVKPPGFAESYLAGKSFRSYIFINVEGKQNDMVMDAVSGDITIYGNYENYRSPLTVGGRDWYVFEKENKTRLVNMEEDRIIELPEKYSFIEPTFELWDNEWLTGKNFIFCIKEDNTYAILKGHKNFEPVKDLPVFSAYDVVFSKNSEGIPVLAGFVLGDSNLARQVTGVYSIPESEAVQVQVYDVDFKKLGTSAYTGKAIGRAFKEPVLLRGGMIAPPGMRNALIPPSGKEIQLNDTFSLVPETGAQEKRLVLVNTKQDKRPVLGQDFFEYRYVSTAEDLKALLQIRHTESRRIFYFDFDGRYFPKGVPLLPKAFRVWEQ